MKQGFSKAWLGVIVLVLILGGILAWQFWLKEKPEIPKEINGEKECKEACIRKGYDSGFCNTPEKRGYIPHSLLCTNNFENYVSHMQCGPDETYYPCCCYNHPLPTLKGDLAVQGKIWLATKLDPNETPNCFIEQALYFNLSSSYPEKIEKVPLALYVDGEKVELATHEEILWRYEEGFGSEPYWFILPGENIVKIPFNVSPPGKTVKIVVDPDNIFKEIDKTNNVIEYTFPEEKMDLSISPLEYGKRLNIMIKRDKVVEYCPKFEIKLYVDGELKNIGFFGFSKNSLQEIARGPTLAPGVYEVRVIIDSENTVVELNEKNNDVAFKITVPK